MTVALYRPAANTGRFISRGDYGFDVPTGSVTTIAAKTASAGQLLIFRNPSSTVSVRLRKLLARFTLTTAYNAAQETGCDLILAHSFTVNGTNGTAVDVGSTVAHSGKAYSGQPTSVITAGCVRVADNAAITAGTHTLDANSYSSLSDWSGAIGDQVPRSTSGAAGNYGVLFDADRAGVPLIFGANQGFVVRNLIVMGAGGVGRWQFLCEWEEGALLDA